MLIRSNRKWFRRLSSIGLISVTIISYKIWQRSNDLIDSTDEFSKYTNDQQRKYFLSGMHQPFLTQDQQQLNLFNKSFSQYQFLIQSNIQNLIEKHSLQTPLKFQSMENYSHHHQNNKIDFHIQTLCVGGPPALISAVHLIEQEKEKDLIYLNDSRRIPIANGSAWHLEQDAQTEGPTNYKPSKFLFDQLKRFLFNSISLKEISMNGEFPWRTIDWIEWFRHPEHWYRALKLSLQYQWFTMFGNRTQILNDVAQQCFINESFFDQLNIKCSNKLLREEHGSIIIARNQQEMNDLNELKENLIKEQRNLNILSKETIKEHYGFIPSNGLMFAQKPHDRVLVPNFMQILNQYLIQQGGICLDGTLETIYIDSRQQEGGGIALFRNRKNEIQSISFSRCILSLGNQEIFHENQQRLFDVISARGVSILAFIYLPKHIQLPSVLVCGGTNHLTQLAIDQSNHQQNIYLMRLTSGACITPNLSNQFTSFYDSTIAIGLLKSIQMTLGNESLIKPILIYGCNRQVSQYGQIQWIEPYQNIFIQYGAAGGGLTRAPDLITTLKKQ